MDFDAYIETHGLLTFYTVKDYYIFLRYGTIGFKIVAAAAALLVITYIIRSRKRPLRWIYYLIPLPLIIAATLNIFLFFGSLIAFAVIAVWQFLGYFLVFLFFFYYFTDGGKSTWVPIR